MGKRTFWGILLLIALLVLPLSGCGPSKAPPASPRLTRIEVTVDDLVVTSNLVVKPEGNIQFAARGYDQNGNMMKGLTFQWEVKPDSLGTIFQDGLFVAGKEAVEGEVICEANGVTKRVSVTVSKEEPKLDKIIVSPEEAIVRPENSREFQATAFDQYGEPMSGFNFTWLVEPSGLGTIASVNEDASTAEFTAGEVTGEGKIICQVDGFEKRAEAKVKVSQEDSRLSSIHINPTQVVVAPKEETKPFEVKAFDQFGEEMDGITFAWSVEPAWLGTINEQTRVFTAGEKSGNGEIVCQAGGVTQKVTVSVFSGDLYLQAAAEQLVDDTQTAWANFIAAPRMTEIMNGQLIPAAMLVYSALDTGLSVPDCHDSLYYCEPTAGNNYYDLEVIYASFDYESPPKTGTWRYIEEVFREDEFTGEEYVDGYLKAVITRNIVNDEDQILFNLRFEDLDGEWLGTYTGELRYPTANWDEWDYDEFDEYPREEEIEDTVKLSVRFELPGNIQGKANLNGYSSETAYIYRIYDEEWDYYYYEVDYVIHAFAGDADGNFTFNGRDYSFDGELNLDFSHGKTDYFTGRINLPDAVITGDMEIHYTSNPNQMQPLVGSAVDLVPKRIELDGSFKDKKSALELTGDLTLEFKRAESFVYYEPYSPTNWPGLKISFDGKLFNEYNDSLVGTLTFEEMANKGFRIDIGYDLMADGVTRRIGLNARTVSDQKVKIEITSDWGPAAINMDLTFDPYFVDIEENEFMVGELKGLSGEVLVQEVKVGEISLTDLGVKVQYKDGSYETF